MDNRDVVVESLRSDLETMFSNIQGLEASRSQVPVRNYWEKTYERVMDVLSNGGVGSFAWLDGQLSVLAACTRGYASFLDDDRTKKTCMAWVKRLDNYKEQLDRI